MSNEIPWKVGPPDDLAAIVDALCLGVGSSKTSEIGHAAVIPEERMDGRDARSSIGNKARERSAHNHARPLIVASRAGSRIRSTERADVLNLSVLPHERSHLRGG